MSSADTTGSRATVALTDQQQRIVAHDRGPALVYAAAGAGKTTAMVHRAERLVGERVFAPQRILLSSFSDTTPAKGGGLLAACHRPEAGRHAWSQQRWRVSAL